MAAYLVAYTLTAWNPIYHLYATPSQAFSPRYASTVEALFDGNDSDQDTCPRARTNPSEVFAFATTPCPAAITLRPDSRAPGCTQRPMSRRQLPPQTIRTGPAGRRHRQAR